MKIEKSIKLSLFVELKNDDFGDFQKIISQNPEFFVQRNFGSGDI